MTNLKLLRSLIIVLIVLVYYKQCSSESVNSLVMKAEPIRSCYLCNPLEHGKCERVPVPAEAFELCLDGSDTCYTYIGR